VGELIAFSGDQINFLMLVLQGSVKGEMVDFSGKVIKIDDIPAPQVLAAAFLFGKENRFPVNIIANEKTTIFYIPTVEFVKLLQSEMQILLNYLEVISNIARFLSEKIKFLSFKTIKGKIAQYILKLAGENLDKIELPVPQQILAEMFGVTRPSLARGLGELVQEGIIQVERRDIHILDRQKLMDLLG
jgi:CRP-like cAMP-binding protein